MSRPSFDAVEHARAAKQQPRDLGTAGLSLFQTETGVTAPTPKPATGEQRRDRVLDALEAKRRDWIDRIHAALVRQLAANGYDGLVTVNDARAVFLALPGLSDEDKAADLRFFGAVWKRPGWIVADWEGRSQHRNASRIARFRYDPNAAERLTSGEAA